MHLTGLSIVILLIAAAVWFLHDTKPVGRRTTGRVLIGVRRVPPHLRLLEERYAPGEISRDEYLEKKRELER